ncbi:MAG: gamma-glutamyltransferase [Gemmatimonadaceae bacterium]
MKYFRSAIAALALVACHPQPSTTPTHGATDVGTPQTLSADGRYIPAADRRPGVFPAAWRHKAGRAPVMGAHAMVASDAPLGSAAGVEILKRGGNAVDAAVAVGFAIAVAYPEAGNIGGGGYMIIRMADGRTAALDYREIAPLAATRNMYLDATGTLTDKSIIGPLASGVPGAVAGLTEALAKYGTMSLAEVMSPAIRYAEEGIVVDSALANSFRGNAKLLAEFEGKSLFLPEGKPLPAGSTLKQPALAQTLRAIAARGRAAFYEGPIAERWTNELRSYGGIITTDDLKGYKAVWREPVRSTYRGHSLYTMPPSSSGGVTITETLNILEGYDSLPAYGSAGWAHTLGSAYQRAFVDRNEKLADPAFVPVPIAQLTDKTYAAKLRATIGNMRATPTNTISTAMREGMETTHYSVVDEKGNAVATTTTLNNLYGSGVYLTSAGFFLNDEMDDFAAQPGTANMFGLVQGEANAIQPGKRMLSAMSPTIVTDRDGSLLLVLGSRGGPRIITSTSEVVLNVIDYRMTLADAMSAPRLHHQALPDSLYFERDAVRPEVADSLRAMGYGVSMGRGIGLVNAIMRVRGGYEGVSDPRSSGRPIGY